MDEAFTQAARAAFDTRGPRIVLGSPRLGDEGLAEPIVSIPLSVANRHGLIAGATGTGKTRTLQLMAEQFSTAGVPAFLVDVKGDLTGLARAGEASPRVTERAAETGHAWKGEAFPVEFLSLTGARGARVRATVSSFGPLLLAKVLDLNPTQTSVLAMVFKYCDDHDLELVDLADLRAVLLHLSQQGAADLTAYGGMSKATVGVLLREITELDAQGAEAFFGEPEFELDDLLVTGADGRGRLTVLEVADVQDKPALWSTFLLWLLARLYGSLPEVGDVDRPKLAFFFDEAHLLFDDATEAFREQVEQVVRLIRSKGVGVYFVTQSPRDLPDTVLGQLGHKVQHALRAFTPDDEKALRAAARTFPKTPFYAIEQTLQSLGIGEALVTTLSARGVPSPPFATRLVPPAASMAALDDATLRGHVAASPLTARYATDVDPESAAEKLAAAAPAADASAAPESAPRSRGTRAPKEPPGALEQIFGSPLTRTIAGQVTRSLMGALLGPAPRRRRRR